MRRREAVLRFKRGHEHGLVILETEVDVGAQNPNHARRRGDAGRVLVGGLLAHFFSADPAIVFPVGCQWCCQSHDRTLARLDRHREARGAPRATRKECLDERPTLVGTPGDDRIRATPNDDVIITLGGNDVIMGPPARSGWTSICTGTGDDQVVYAWPDGGIEATSGSGGETTGRPSRRGSQDRCRCRDDTILLRRTSWADVAPGPGDDLIRGPRLRGEFRTTCVDLRWASRPVRIDLAEDVQRDRDTTGPECPLRLRQPVRRRAARHPRERLARRRWRARPGACPSR